MAAGFGNDPSAVGAARDDISADERRGIRLGTPAPGRVFAMLYFTNSAGAVIGVLLAGFWLIEWYGLQATIIAAGAGKLVVALVAWTISRHKTRSGRGTAARAHARHRPLAARLFVSDRSLVVPVRDCLAADARARARFVDPCVETMLAAFILGIALGGLWIRRRIERYQSPLRVLGTVQILMGLAALATLPAPQLRVRCDGGGASRLHEFAHGLRRLQHRRLPDLRGDHGAGSVFAGMTLPLLTHVLYQRGRGSEIGAVYGWNTLGGIAGIALGGLVLMPLIGLKNMIVLGARSTALGVALLASIANPHLPAPRMAVGLSGMAIAAVLVTRCSSSSILPGWSPVSFALALRRSRARPKSSITPMAAPPLSAWSSRTTAVQPLPPTASLMQRSGCGVRVVISRICRARMNTRWRCLRRCR